MLAMSARAEYENSCETLSSEIHLVKVNHKVCLVSVMSCFCQDNKHISGVGNVIQIIYFQIHITSENFLVLIVFILLNTSMCIVWKSWKTGWMSTKINLSDDNAVLFISVFFTKLLPLSKYQPSNQKQLRLQVSLNLFLIKEKLQCVSHYNSLLIWNCS